MVLSAVARFLPVRLVAAPVIAGLLAAGPITGAPPAHEGRRWTLVFSDEFDGSALDPAKWSHHYPWSRTHNHSAYSREQNVAVTGGRLVLTAREESFGGKPYTTGVVNTQGKFHATFGYIEARLRMPSTIGSWPAFWMLRDGWPPEIDIMEFPLSDVSQAHNEKYRYWWNYHWGTVSDHRSAGAEVWQGSDLTAGFHDYAVEWTPKAMRFHLDGAPRGEVTDRGAIAESAGMYIILNYAVGGWPGEPASWPAAGDTYEIDWVRAWTLEEPEDLIDLGDIVGGGSGDPRTPSPYAGIHPDTGAFSDDLGLNGVSPTGANPEPVAASLIDSVFLLTADTLAVNTAGTRFGFPQGDSSPGSWDLIANLVEPDGPRGFLEMGPRGVFTHGIGIHASSGVTFDLDAIRASSGAQRVAFFSAHAGEGSLQAGGTVRCHALLAGADGALLHSVSTGPHTDGGRFLEVPIPRNARFLTLAAGDAGDGNAMDHGVFADAFLSPCSGEDPDLCPPVADEVLSFSRAAWKYLDAGAAPPAAWTSLSFGAAGWKEGRGPFGYGEGDEGTAVDFGPNPDQKRITTHFRRVFSVAGPGEVRSLSLWVARDDGVVVYLNGVEVLRSNLPEGAIAPGTLASATVNGDSERRWVLASGIDPCLLESGPNVLAAEVHQAAPNSSDLRFDLVLAADRGGPSPCGPNIIRGDCNDDDDVNLSDALCILGWLFLGGAAPGCAAVMNANGDPGVDVSDPIFLLEYLFLGGAPPAAPFPGCGPALPSDAEHGCGASSSGCG
jgi:beta-glucanase (GH16 family)